MKTVHDELKFVYGKIYSVRMIRFTEKCFYFEFIEQEFCLQLGFFKSKSMLNRAPVFFGLPPTDRICHDHRMADTPV